MNYSLISYFFAHICTLGKEMRLDGWGRRAGLGARPWQGRPYPFHLDLAVILQACVSLGSHSGPCSLEAGLTPEPFCRHFWGSVFAMCSASGLGAANMLRKLERLVFSI